MIKMTDSGETLIKKCQRILDEGEPLTDGAPMIYTPKQAGVKPECNVRADKWYIAMSAMDRVNSYKLTEYLKEGVTTESELGAKINAKYDAELAALEKQTPSGIKEATPNVEDWSRDVESTTVS